MANLKKSGIQIWLAAFFLCISMSAQVKAAAAGPPNTQADAAETENTAQAGSVRAEAGIIEVESGFVDAKGNFWKMKAGSGFLISNKESATYIVTSCSNVSNTPGKIKKFCKKHSIDTENMQFTNSIRLIVTGDVTADAEVVMKSAEKDYCVLSAANVVSQKESLKLGSSTNLAVNDLVYAYGFPKADSQNPIAYSEMDVRPIQGAVTQTEAYLEGGVYLAHSAPVLQGYEGGPLLDADGYVIGLNCRQSPEDDTGTAYALPIDEISAVLDNFSIYYGSRTIDEAYAQLASAYQECMQIQAAGGYKNASMETLAQALETAEEIMNQEEPAAADLSNAAQMLLKAEDALVPKTGLLTIFICIMAALDLILFIWMLILAVKNSKEKKRMEMQRMQPVMPSQVRQQKQQMPHNADYARQQAPPASGYQRRQAPQNAASARQPVAPPAGRRLHMIRQKTGQSIVLNKNQFIIGKNQTLADYCIPDNQTISRKHAMLFEDNGSWYIDDLNSLNGTCVNGRKIVPGQAVKLKSGDEITLSDEAFLVQS